MSNSAQHLVARKSDPTATDLLCSVLAVFSRCTFLILHTLTHGNTRPPKPTNTSRSNVTDIEIENGAELLQKAPIHFNLL